MRPCLVYLLHAHVLVGDMVTVLPMVSHYSTDEQVAVTQQGMLQCASKCTAGNVCNLMYFTKLALQRFYEEENASNGFVRPQGYILCFGG